MHYVTQAAFEIVTEYVADVAARPRYRDESFFIDGDGSEGDELRHFTRGGFWNCREMDRAAFGFTKADAKGLQRELRAIGFDMTLDECDALLLQAETGYLKSTMSQEPAKRRKATAGAKVGKSAKPRSDAKAKAVADVQREQARQRKARQRERAREAGLCVVNPAHGKVTGKSGAACQACQDAANEALAVRRRNLAAERRQEAKPSGRAKKNPPGNAAARTAKPKPPAARPPAKRKRGAP